MSRSLSLAAAAAQFFYAIGSIAFLFFFLNFVINVRAESAQQPLNLAQSDVEPFHRSSGRLELFWLTGGQA